MDCPVCTNVNLVMSDRQGIEIDYCPQCRGVWLDRGELDKLIERSGADASPPEPRQQRSPSPAYEAPRHEAPRYDSRGSDQYHQRKKKSLLGELFDF